MSLNPASYFSGNIISSKNSSLILLISFTLHFSLYNDIFIPNMIILSPKYKEYHDALTSINNRICNDLGLYYDSNYNLSMK